MAKDFNIQEGAFSCVEIEKTPMKGYTLIEGFPGMGLVGTIAAKYLIDRLRFRETGHIESVFFTPVVRIHQGVPVYPSRIYVNRGRKLVVLISEQLIPKLLTVRLASAVADWVEQKGIRRVISLEGIRTHGPEGTGSVYGIAANAQSVAELKKHGVDIVEDGITTGVTAMILLELKKRGKVPGYSLLGNVNMVADYKAAAAVLKKLSAILGLPLDVRPLQKEARETEAALLEQMKNLKKVQKQVEAFEARAGPAAPPMYA